MRKNFFSGSRKENLNYRRKKAALTTLVVVLLVCVFAVGTAAAKYLIGSSEEGVVRAQDFYFTSNLLDGGNHSLAPGSTEVSFTLSNHADELRYSEMDITYTVTVANEGTGGTAPTVKINGAEGITGKMNANAKSDADITLSGLEPGGKYTVTAVGNGGYTKTLTATIEVPVKVTAPYYYIDKTNSEYTLVTIWNEMETEAEVIITYTGIPDNTNPDMINWTTGEGHTDEQVMIGSHESKVLRFFDVTAIKVDGADPKEPN